MKKSDVQYVVATAFFRKMRGGSQSCLVKADDGNFYIVKLLCNPQGSKVLFNEAFGTELMRMIDLPVPQWSPVLISDEFIERNPGLWFEAVDAGHQRPSAGLHFGSRFVAPSEAETVYELLPRSWFPLIDNRECFVGALLFDLWANQMDNRQALFLRNAGDRSIHTIFIDQGCLFGDEKAGQLNDSMRAMFLDRMMYANLDVDLIVPLWESRIQNLEIAATSSRLMATFIPAQWYTPITSDRIAARLLEGQRSLEFYSSQVKRFLRNGCVETPMNTPHAPLGDIQVRCPELRTESAKRVSHPVSGIR